MCEPENAFTFVDNHDNQRGHGGGDASITFKDPYMYGFKVPILKLSLTVEIYKKAHPLRDYAYV